MMNATTIQRYKKKSVSDLLKKATEVFNAYIRERDREGDYFTCISCGERKRISGGNYHAGHYYPSTVSALRFHEHNVNGQCDRCNYFLHGNQIEYRKRLIKKIGEDAVIALDDIKAQSTWSGYRWDRFSLIDIIQTYKAKGGKR